MMNTRAALVEFCLTLENAYEDYPFDDPNWTVMRRRDTKRGFAWIFEKDGRLRVNLKSDPEWAIFVRNAYEGVIPAYHMNKRLWNSVITGTDVPDEELKQFIVDSYRLCGKK